MSDDLLSLRLLVVSDSTAQRDLLRSGAGLASMPIDFGEAASASAAGDSFKRSAPDILIVDCEMTGASDLVAASRSLPAPPLALACVRGQGASRPAAPDGIVMAPADTDQARAAVDRCIKATMPTRAMVVDDSATMRSIVRKILAACRFKLDVSDVAEGALALDRIKAGGVDIVFLDYNMPGLNGIETLSEIKRGAPQIAVVMITSTLDPAVATQAKNAGAAAFLKKPFFPKDIDAVMERYHGLHGPDA